MTLTHEQLHNHLDKIAFERDGIPEELEKSVETEPRDDHGRWTKQDFHDLAMQQRDRPERAMVQYQHALGGGVMGPAVEHAGDLIHRMAEHTTWETGGYEFVKEKVNRLIGYLTHPYGFMREHRENIDSNAKYSEAHEGKSQLTYHGDVGEAINSYVVEHSKLRPINQAQRLAQDVAMNIGRGRIGSALIALDALNEHLGSREEWVKFAHEGLGEPKELEKHRTELSKAVQSSVVAFHGTSTTHLPRIFAQGLRSTHETRIKNFGKIPSGSDMTAKTRGVYMTDDPSRALSISNGAVQRHKGDHAVVVSHVHPHEAVADEDYHEYIANNLKHMHPGDGTASEIRASAAKDPHFSDIAKGMAHMPDSKVVALHKISRHLENKPEGVSYEDHYAKHYAQADKLITAHDTWHGFGSAAFPGNRPHSVAGAISIPHIPSEKYDAFQKRIAPVHEVMTTHRDNPERMFAEAEKLPGVTVHRNPAYHSQSPLAKAFADALQLNAHHPAIPVDGILVLVKAYDPNEPRDKAGRWTKRCNKEPRPFKARPTATKEYKQLQSQIDAIHDPAEAARVTDEMNSSVPDITPVAPNGGPQAPKAYNEVTATKLIVNHAAKLGFDVNTQTASTGTRYITLDHPDLPEPIILRLADHEPSTGNPFDPNAMAHTNADIEVDVNGRRDTSSPTEAVKSLYDAVGKPAPKFITDHIDQSNAYRQYWDGVKAEATRRAAIQDAKDKANGHGMYSPSNADIAAYQHRLSEIVPDTAGSRKQVAAQRGAIHREAKEATGVSIPNHRQLIDALDNLYPRDTTEAKPTPEPTPAPIEPVAGGGGNPLRMDGTPSSRAAKAAAIDAEAAKVLADIKSGLGKTVNSGVDPVVYAKLIRYGALKMASGMYKFADWSAHMVETVGDWIKPHLRDLWDRANAHLQEEEARIAAAQSRPEAKSAPYKPSEEAGGTTVAETAAIEPGTLFQREPQTDTPKYESNDLRDKNDVSYRQPQVNTPEFSRWFGDSEIKNEYGEPLRVYHTTDANFKTFSKNKLGRNTIGNAATQFGEQSSLLGHWFSDHDIGNGSKPSEQVYPCYLKIENPYRPGASDDLHFDIEQAGSAKKLKQSLIDQGYDGIEINDQEHGGKSYIAFDRSQIKSAIGNNGKFDPGSNLISKAHDVSDEARLPAGTKGGGEWTKTFGSGEDILDGTIKIPGPVIDKFKASIEDLNKRARRLKLPEMVVDYGEPVYEKFKRVHGIGSGRDRREETEWVNIPIYHVTVKGKTPKLNGWTLAGIVKSDSGIALFHSMPGEQIPAKYRKGSKMCDHCKTERKRNIHFIVRNDKGVYKQVGSDCVKDFTGHKDAEQIAAYLDALYSFTESPDWDEDWEPGGGGDKAAMYDIDVVLAAAVAHIRMYGYRKTSDGYGANGEKPTRDEIVDLLWPGKQDATDAWSWRTKNITSADRAKARAIISFFKKQPVEWQRKSDYNGNLFAVAKLGMAGPNQIGFAASMVPYFNKENDKSKAVKDAANPNKKTPEFVGKIGERRNFTVTIRRKNITDGQYGSTFIYNMQDEDGNNIVWFASNPIGVKLEGRNSEDYIDDTHGVKLVITATVKDHNVSRYNGQKETIITRGKVVSHEVAKNGVADLLQQREKLLVKYHALRDKIEKMTDANGKKIDPQMSYWPHEFKKMLEPLSDKIDAIDAKMEAAQKLKKAVDKDDLAKAYDPNEPRGDDGRWTDGPKSKGHVAFVADKEYFHAPSGDLHSVHRGKPVDDGGYRNGSRFESTHVTTDLAVKLARERAEQGPVSAYEPVDKWIERSTESPGPARYWWGQEVNAAVKRGERLPDGILDDYAKTFGDRQLQDAIGFSSPSIGYRRKAGYEDYQLPPERERAAAYAAYLDSLNEPKPAVKEPRPFKARPTATKEYKQLQAQMDSVRTAHEAALSKLYKVAKPVIEAHYGVPITDEEAGQIVNEHFLDKDPKSKAVTAPYYRKLERLNDKLHRDLDPLYSRQQELMNV